MGQVAQAIAIQPQSGQYHMLGGPSGIFSFVVLDLRFQVNKEDSQDRKTYKSATWFTALPEVQILNYKYNGLL
jgi:hypothetical protein